MKCPKCNRFMSKNNRACDRDREIWVCLWKKCRHVLRVPITNKDELIKSLHSQLDKSNELHAKWEVEAKSLQSRLTAAEKRAEELEGALENLRGLLRKSGTLIEALKGK